MKHLVAGAAATALMIGSANAALVGFELFMPDYNNEPHFELKNISGEALLVRFTFSIGDEDNHNFDAVRFRDQCFVRRCLDDPRGAPEGGTTELVGIDDDFGGGLRNDVFDIRFTSFDPGDMAFWSADIDEDNGGRKGNFRTTFANNGAAPNSVATAYFSDGTILSFVFPDLKQPTYFFEVTNVVPAPVPVPAGAILMAPILGAMGLSARRRRKA